MAMRKPKRKPKRKPARKKANPRIKRKQKRLKRQKRPKRTRAQAAKRGWATRRQKQIDAERKIKLGERRQRRVNPELMRLLERAQRAESELQKERERAEKYLTQVAKLEREYEVRDKLVESLIAAGQLVESDETRIIARLRLAEIDGAFEEEVGLLADEFDMQPHEIYTLWMSP